MARPLYVYLYDIHAEGEASLLYPYESGMSQRPFQPRILYTLPAESVMHSLALQLVPRHRLVARSYGETRPISPYGTREEQAINLRVEFVRLDR